MIKLIASDIDGTLLPYGEKEIPEKLFPLIHRLREKSILFCPASGRQYHSLRQLFAPAADELCFLCENGAAVFGVGGEEDSPLLSSTVFPRDVALELSHDVMEQGWVVISGLRSCYTCGASEEFRYFMEESLGNRVLEVEKPEDIAEEIVKISAYCPDGTDPFVEALGPKWGSWNMAVAGPIWLDFGVADKGKGLRGLCKALNIGLDEVVAFGDNWNDVAMLQTAGHPYLMATAHEELRKMFPRQCENVLEVLERILAGTEKF